MKEFIAAIVVILLLSLIIEGCKQDPSTNTPVYQKSS